jgi:VIT1/CCC1 family predicted Fe2+/Mn2+ transporter
VASAVLSALAAIAVGVILAAFTRRPMLRSALRQLVMTAGAAAVTYGVGRGIGTGLG